MDYQRSHVHSAFVPVGVSLPLLLIASDGAALHRKMLIL